MHDTDKIEVTQADREAAANHWYRTGRVTRRDADAILAAKWDEFEDIKDFSRYRTASVASATREKDAEIERWISAYNIAHDQALENGHALARLRAKLDEAIAHYDIEPENWMLAVEAVEILRAFLASAPQPSECPKCGSKQPHLHPAMQAEGEVELCVDDFHLIETPSNTEKYRQGVLDKRSRAPQPEPVSNPYKLPDEASIKHMVDRFLGWRLPADFSPDGGIIFSHTSGGHANAPTGTNLFTAAQAEAMVRYMMEVAHDR